MEKQRRAPNVDIKMFNCIKILIQGGAQYKEISDYTGVQKTTIQRINSVETWEEYLQVLAAMALTQREKKAKERAEKEAAARKDTAKKLTEALHNLEPEKEEEKKEPTQVVEHRQSVTVQTTYYVSQKLDAMTELLKGISAKLACIIDDLYGPKKEEKKDA